MGEKADGHSLFHLTTANDGQLHIRLYTETDINLLGLQVLNIGFLIMEEPNSILDKKHHTRLPRNHRLEYGMACLTGFCGKI